MSSASDRDSLPALTWHARHLPCCTWQLPHFDLHKQHVGTSVNTAPQQVLGLTGGDEGVMQHIAACMGPVRAQSTLSTAAPPAHYVLNLDDAQVETRA